MDSDSNEHVPTEVNESWTKYLKLDNALLLAAVPLLAYALITAHTVGRYRYFGVPYELISISFTDNLFAIILVSVLASAALMIMALLFQGARGIVPRSRTYIVWSSKLEPMFPHYSQQYRPFFSAATGAALVLALMLLYSYSYRELLYFGVRYPMLVAAGIVLVASFASLFIYSHVTSAMIEWSLEERQEQRRAALNAISVVTLFVSLGFTSYMAGVINAERQEDFWVLDGAPEMVVVYMTNDRLVATNFDRTDHLTGDAISIIYLEDLGDRTLRFEAIGQLMPYSRYFWTWPPP